MNPDTLTPTLSLDQLKQNIDALQKGGMATSDIQGYVNKYQKQSDGSYSVKSQPNPNSSFSPTAGNLFQYLFNKAPGHASPLISKILGVSSLGGAESGVMDAMTSGEQGAGKEISATIEERNPGVQKAQNAAQASTNQLAQVNSRLIQEIHKMKAEGRDTTSLEQLVQDNNKTIQSTGYNANLPAGAMDTPEQVVGNFAQMALDVLASGELQKGATSFHLLGDAEKARMAEMGVKDSTEAKTLLRRLYNVARKTVPLGYGYDVSQNLKGGAQGASTLMPGWGTALSLAFPLTYEGIKGIRPLISSMGSPKSLEEVLATSEADVMKGKLNSGDTEKWFKAKNDAIDAQATANKAANSEKFGTAINENQKSLSTLQTNAKTEIASLQNEVTNSAVGESKTIATKLRSTFQKASDTFGALRAEELSKANITPESSIPMNNVRSYLTNAFKEDGNLAETQMQLANLPKQDPMEVFAQSKGAESKGAELQPQSDVNKTLQALLGDTGSKDTMTVKDILQTQKDLSQGISVAARKGTRTFTSDEMAKMNVIHAYDQLLQDKFGVNMSESNKFWAEWKPVQREVMQKFDVFGQRGSAGVKSGAEALASKAENNPYTKDFFSKLEGYMGKPIGGETQAAFDKIAPAQQEAITKSADFQKFIEDLQSQLKDANKQVEQEAQQKGVSIESDKYKAMKKAKFNTIKKNAIKGLLGTTVVGGTLSAFPGVRQFITSLLAGIGL